MAKKAKGKKGEEPAPGYFPDMAPVRDAELQEKSETFEAARKACGTARREMKDAHDNMMALMRKKNVVSFKSDNGLEWWIEDTPKIKSKNPIKEKKRKKHDDASPAEGNEINPGPTGRSEVLDGVKELAEEGSEDPTK